MEADILRKVQLVQLEMLHEIDRVCRENGIRYFLYRGTMLGAVRHKGFIPWDDDLDVGMLRADYEKFCRIAPEKLDPQYCLQNWHTDPNYALPFGKLRKRGTMYLEAKSAPLAENGLYVDLYPLDFAPAQERARRILAGKLLHLFRVKLMKSGYTPWMEEDRVLWKKRVGYLPYQLAALFVSQQWLIRRYEKLVAAVPENEMLYEQSALPKTHYFQRKWCVELGEFLFEDGAFPGPRAYDECLTALYGDYMTLPPEGSRENRHQIVKMDFGESGRKT